MIFRKINKKKEMFTILPVELILEIFDFLNFGDLSKIYCTCKYIPKVLISYKTYTRKTIVYTGKTGKTEKIMKSYLLTNGSEDRPNQIKDNYLEIKITRYKTKYHFTFYKEIYNPEFDILTYLQNIDWSNTRKYISNVL